MMNRGVLDRQMFANGGQAVPNEYKGFSQLPEAVQMKMDPVAAKKYKEGGEIRAGISEELRRDIDRVKAQLIEEEMQQQRQMENITSLQALRNKARYDVPLLGLDDVSNELPTNEEGFDPNNIYNILRFFDRNPEFDVSDYNEVFKTNLDPRDFSVLEKEAEPPAVGMAMGGDPAMAQGVGSMMPPPPAMPPMEGGQAVDPQMVEQMLASAGEGIQDLESVDNFEQMMNSIRGDDASVEERRAELAGIVGEEDAAQTPESVLALAQPAIMMASVDQGIGGLAQEQMSQEVSGPMAQGIMSTVQPPAEGPPPVNFKDGGLVRRGDNQPVLKFQNAGVVPNLVTAADFRKAIGPSPSTSGFVNPPTYDERVLAAAKGAEERYAAAGLGTAAERAAALEEQKNLTKAQMLFDIAQTALTFAGPMQGERPGASAAERLAMAASATKLPQTIGARAQTLAEQKKAADKEERALKLAAVQRGETQVDAEIARTEARALQKLKNKTTAVKATKPFVTTKDVVIDGETYATGTLLNLRPAQVAQATADALKPYAKETGEAGAKKAYTVTKPITVDGVQRNRGDAIVVSSIQANQIDNFSTSVIPYKAPEKKGDVNVIFPDNTQQVFTPGTEAYDAAIKPVSEGGKGGLLAGVAKAPDTDTVNLRMPDGTTKTLVKNSSEFNKAIKSGAVLSGKVSEKDRKLVNMINSETDERQTVVEFSDDYYSLAKQGFGIGSTISEAEAPTTKSVRTTESITVNGTNIPAGTAVLLSDADIAEAQQNFGANVFEPYEKLDAVNPFGKTGAGLALNYFTNAKTADGQQLAIDAYAEGADDRTMESQIKAYTAPVADARGLMQKRQLPDFVVEAITKRVLADPTKKSPVPLVTLNLTQSQLNMLRPSQDVPILNEDNTINIDRITADPTFIITGIDLTQSQGFVSSVNRFKQKFAGQFAEFGIGDGYAGNDARITSKADKQLEVLARNTIEAARTDKDGRIFALDLELLQEEVKGFRPGGFRTDVEALEQLRATRSGLASKYSDAKFIIDEAQKNPAIFESGQVGDAMISERKLKKLIAEYSVAILAYEANLRPGGAAANVSGGSATANSQRVDE